MMVMTKTTTSTTWEGNETENKQKPRSRIKVKWKMASRQHATIQKPTLMTNFSCFTPEEVKEEASSLAKE